MTRPITFGFGHGDNIAAQDQEKIGSVDPFMPTGLGERGTSKRGINSYVNFFKSFSFSPKSASYGVLNMKVLGSIIARLGSKRLPYKNLLPFAGKPMLGLGIEKLRAAQRVDAIVVSTESELIARVARDFGAEVLMRPAELARDDVPSVPVFQHIVRNYPCDIHVNFNINFPLCEPAVIDRAVELVAESGEVLSRPYAVWAQTAECLMDYGDPWQITALQFDDERAGHIDVHTEADLLAAYRWVQNAG